MGGNGATPRHESDVVLRDGSTVHVRDIRRDDLEGLRTLLEGMSPEARRLRFFTSGADVESAAQWAAAIGERDGLGVLATAGDPARVVGHADYERIDDRRAEIAFEVADALRGKGLATILMAHLAGAARAAGISTFVAEVLPENRRMLEVFRESGFPMRMVHSSGELAIELTTDLSEAALLRYLERERIAAAAAVRHFLEPDSLAVVGASTRPGSVGRQVLGSILRSGFDGTVYPVNPRHRRMRGMRCYPSVAALPGPVELVVVATPAAACRRSRANARSPAYAPCWSCRAASPRRGGWPQAPGGAARRLPRRRHAPRRPELPRPDLRRPPARRHVLAADRPAGPRRAALPERRRGARADRALREAGSRVLVVRLDRQQGGHLGERRARVLGGGRRTDAVLLYLESFGNPRNFARIARRLARSKPIAAVRAGRSAAGARAAASHTGAAVAASDAGADALFRQAGIMRAETLGELFDIGHAAGHASRSRAAGAPRSSRTPGGRPSSAPTPASRAG